jgi:hypothetical protein
LDLKYNFLAINNFGAYLLDPFLGKKTSIPMDYIGGSDEERWMWR